MKTSFKDFAKEYWGLFFAVVVIPTSLFSIYFIAYSNHEIDKSISATFLTCIISYIGTIGLSIFIFHNSWLKGKEEEYRNRPRVSIGRHYDCYKLKNGDGHQCFFTYERIKEDPNLKLDEIKIFDDNDDYMEETQYDYVGIIIKNHSSHLVYSNVFRGIYIVDRGEYRNKEECKVQRQKGRIWFSLKDNPSTLAFKDTAMHFLGIEKKLVDTTKPIRREIYILLSIEDDFSKEHHYLLPTQYINGTMLDGIRKEINDKQLDNLYQNPRVLLDWFDRKRIK